MANQNNQKNWIEKITSIRRTYQLIKQKAQLLRVQVKSKKEDEDALAKIRQGLK